MMKSYTVNCIPNTICMYLCVCMLFAMPDRAKFRIKKLSIYQKQKNKIKLSWLCAYVAKKMNGNWIIMEEREMVTLYVSDIHGRGMNIRFPTLLTLPPPTHTLTYIYIHTCARSLELLQFFVADHLELELEIWLCYYMYIAVWSWLLWTFISTTMMCQFCKLDKSNNLTQIT